MARRKQTKKRRSVKKKKRNNIFTGALPLKLIFLTLVSAAALAGAVYGMKYFFLNNGYFDIKEIEINNVRGYSFSSGEKKLKKLYLDRNIFTVDLENVEALIKNDFPQIRRVEVRRVLPDRMVIDVITRAPLAVIDVGGGVVIDKEGVVLTIGEGNGDLIRIRGINFFLNMPERGERVENESLGTALLLASGLKKEMQGSRKEIDYMDISDRNNILLFVSGVEVKMGIDDFLRKITRLKEIIKDPDLNIEDIKYIDLRFKDVVISPK